MLSRRRFVKLSSGSLAILAMPGCAEDPISVDTNQGEMPGGQVMGGMDVTPDTPVELTAEQIAAWEAPGVLTSDEPGEWGEKIVGHYPIMKKQGDQVSVVVPHPMDADHYIEAIYLKDSAGELIAGKLFSASDDLAYAEFTVSGDAEVTAYSVCNLHQVWSAPEIRTHLNPGPWADKVLGHTPKALYDGAQVTVSVPHPMGEEHYIVGVYLLDQDGTVIAKHQLSYDDEASYTFEIPEATTSVQPLALCDDHDLWAGQRIDLSQASEALNLEMGGVLTSNEPGDWAGKIAGHYPIATIADQMVSVQVAHPMDADHYISAIYLRDADGHLLGFKSLSPGDEPSADFFVLDPSAEYYAYAACNLHENWVAPLVRSGDRPGPWEDKVVSHTPALEIAADGASATMTVEHPMNDDHFIVAMYLSDPSGNVVAKTQLNPQDNPVATYTFEDLPSGVTALTPWALCDDHDLWVGPTQSV